MSYKVLVVEDDYVIRLGIVELVKNLKCDVVEASCGNDAINYLQEEKFQMVITDLMMENGSGVDLIEYINRTDYDCIKIVISALTDVNTQVDLFKMGVVDYITKPVNHVLVKQKIKNLISYDGFGFDELEDIVLDSKKKRVTILGEVFELTSKEFFLLEEMKTYPLQVFSKPDLLYNCWGETTDKNDKIVEVNICNLRKKLGKYEGIVKTVKGSGYYYDPGEIKNL